MSVINIELSELDLERVVDQFAATERQVRLAKTRALRRTASWLRKQVLGRAAKDLRIPLRSLAGRSYVSKIGQGDDEITLTIGTLPVNAAKIGNPAQTARGARAGRRTYPGAFVQKIYFAEERVWIRKGSKHYNPASYPTQGRKSRTYAPMPGQLLGRFPVVQAAVPINDVVEQVAESHEAVVSTQFLHNLERELNYEVNVR